MLILFKFQGISTTIMLTSDILLPHKDVFLIFALGRVLRNTVPWAVFPNTLPVGKYDLFIMSYNIVPVASECQEVHPSIQYDLN